MAFPYPYSGPIAPYNNLPIQTQNYQPRGFVISAVSLGQTTTITATESMDFVIGQLVRLLIPRVYGCTQLNDKQAYVIAIPAANQVTLQLDSSRNVNAFTSATYIESPQIIPVGDVNTGAINPLGRIENTTYIDGSFMNISNT